VVHPQIATFARLADGNTAPVRKIEGQKTLMARTMHAISYDEIHDEIMVPQELAQAILTFRGGANGEEPPIRVIQGPLTQMHQPDVLYLDAVHNEIFVPQRDPINKILVFQRDANGNVAPIRILRPSGDVRFGNSVAIDPVNNLLLVAGSVTGGSRSQARLLIYNRTDEGMVAPKAAIGGPNSHYNGGAMAVYPPKGWIIVASNWGGRNRVSDLANDDGYVGVWSIQDSGDVPPRWIVGGPNGIFQQIRNVALDPRNKGLIVADKRLNSVLTFYFPEMF
jgi:hypothetical protein